MTVLYEVKRDRETLDSLIGRIAARQYGVFGRAQAFDLGASCGEMEWRLRTGRWEVVFPKVYRLVGTPGTWHQRTIAACLHWGRDAAVSHRAAAKLRGLCAIRHARIELSVRKSRNRSSSPDVTIHRVNLIPQEDISIVEGIPATRPARTLLDLSATASEHMTARFVDDALRRRLVSLAFLDRWLTDPRRKHHRGASRLRRLVDERMIRGITDSPTESDALTLIRKSGLPMPMLQYIVEDTRGRIIGRLDLAYPEQRVGIELDSFRFHDTRTSFDAERARGNEIQVLGWNILRVTSKHLEEQPDQVVAWIRAATGAVGR